MQPVSLDKKVIKDAYRFVGHTAAVRTMIAWQQYIISGSDDMSIKIWRSQTGECIRTLTGHTKRILCLNMWDGNLVSGSADRTIKIWDIITGKCKESIRNLQEDVNCLISTDKYLFAGCKDGMIYIYNKKCRLEGKIEAHSDWVNSLLIYNEESLISCSDDKTIKIWNIDTKECISTFTGHSEGVQSICIYKNLLVSGGSDFNIFIWNIKTGEIVTCLQGHCDVVSSLVIYKNHYLISTDLSSLIVVWKINERLDKQYEVTLHSDSVYCGLILNKRLYTCSKDCSIVMWPGFSAFSTISSLLNQAIPDKAIPLANRTTMADESITKLRNDIATLRRENQKLIDDQALLHEKLKTSYLTINTLNKDIVDRAEEMNKLRKECSQLRLEVSDNQQKMSAEAQVLTQSYAISPFEVTSSFIRNTSDNAIIHVAMWKYCQVIMKSYSNYKPKLDHRYEWLKAVQVWSSVNHPNIAKVYGCCISEGRNLSLLIEYCPGSLKEIIEYTRMKKRYFSIPVKINLLLQIASALAFLHQQQVPIPHGNIHPSNILMSPTLNPLLTDLCLVPAEQRYLKKKYTSSFIAPECRQQNKPTIQSDIYSLGCLILYIISDGEKTITDGFDFNTIEDSILKYILIKCCNPEAQKRVTITDVIKDLEVYKNNYEKQNSAISLPSSHVVYSKTTGCYLF